MSPDPEGEQELDVMVVGKRREQDEWVDAGASSSASKVEEKGRGDKEKLISTAPENGERKIRVLDYIVCALVIIFMVAAAQVSQILQVDLRFNNPAFIIWFSTSWLIYCFPLQIIYYKKYDGRKGSIVEILGGIDILKKNMKLAPLFALFWYLANYLFVWGIAYTNVASSLAIEQTATVFVFILSVIFLGEVATIGKILSVLVCIGGVFLVAFADKNNMHSGSNPLKGDILIIGSCCATAAYMVTYKKVVGATEVAAVHTLLGFIGIFNLLFFWPLFTILHFVGAEPLAPHTFGAWGMLLLNSALSFCFNYFLNLGIFFTSPLFFRVAQICTIPASFILSIILKEKFVWMQLLGAGVVVLGFSLFSYFSHKR